MIILNSDFLTLTGSQHLCETRKGLFTHAIFHAIFVVLFDAAFAASENLRRFLCDPSAMAFAAIYPKSRRKVLSSFEHVRKLGDISSTNRTEIAASVHLRF